MSQRVIITAAAGGIGRVVADSFVRGGATVHACDVDEQAVAACAEGGAGLRASVVDLTDPVAVDAWMDAAIADMGGVDVLVNNAGTKGPTALVEDVSLEEWRACLAAGLDSHFLCARKVAPLMKAQGQGSIVNISSTAGLYGFGMRTPYAAAKWAVIGLTKSLAVELGPHGVRCNAICPGSVRGDRMDAVIAAEAQHRGVAPEVVETEYVQGQSIKRFVEPQEIADMCLFLASPAAKMISGQAISVDGHTETFHI
ncbi:MAG: SDR family oxidoreductase [Actinomycetota bacterium]|nr:SDR family oxidoreductase [Actinomycetota bacterium]